MRALCSCLDKTWPEKPSLGARRLTQGPLDRMCRKCEGHEDAVRVLAVAAGKVFSGSYDGTIGVW